MAATGRRKIGDYLIGTPDDTVSALTNSFQGQYSFTHRSIVTLNDSVDIRFHTTVAPVMIKWSVRCQIDRPDVIGRQRDQQANPAEHTPNLTCTLLDFPPSLDDNHDQMSRCRVRVDVLGEERRDYCKCNCGPPRKYGRVSKVKRPKYADNDVPLYTVEQEVRSKIGPNKAFTVPLISSNDGRLERYVRNVFRGSRCRVTVTLELPASLFRLNLSRNIRDDFKLPDLAIIEDHDFRFQILENTSLHDFTILCPDGEVKTNRSALLQCSAFFGEFFLSSAGRLHRQFQTTAPKAIVEALLLYLYTGCFRLHHRDLTPASAKAFCDLVVTHVREERQPPILHALELCCIEKVLQVGDRLDELLPWLPYGLMMSRAATATQSQHARRILVDDRPSEPRAGARLESVCSALVYDYHWNDYFLLCTSTMNSHPATASAVAAMKLNSLNADSPHKRLKDGLYLARPRAMEISK